MTDLVGSARLVRPVSLTARLVATAVALVAIVSLAIGTAAWVVIRTTLYHQLDNTVLTATGLQSGISGPGRDHHGEHGGPGDFEDDRPALPSPDQFTSNVVPGTIVAWPELSYGYVTGDRRGDQAALTTGALAALAVVPDDGAVHDLQLPGGGEYRVAIGQDATGEVLLVGAPTHGAQETLRGLLFVELISMGLALAAASGLGLLLVRRQLRPLREVAATAHAVAELPLSSGEINLAARVPERLTDDRTEVGQVGSALNRMLAHVESSLEARQRSEQQVRQFVADASHELRTPLATIAGYTELARRRPDDLSGLRTALDKVESESGRMTTLVSDLLLLARLDAGRPLDRATVDLSRLVIEAVSDARVLSPAHHWRIDLPDEAVEITGDEQALHQVVTNLLANARRYTPDGTTVTVRAGGDGGAGGGGDGGADSPGWCALVVADDGPGFPPEVAAYAFERFVRGDAARNRDGGTGLGLALVKAITEAHGGTVSLASEPGDTKVTVRLPVG